LNTVSTSQTTQRKAGTDPQDPRFRSDTHDSQTVNPNENIYFNIWLVDAISGEIIMERNLQSSSRITSGVERAAYILTGELRGLSAAGSGGDRSDYILMTFQLVDPASNEILWEDIFETKRESSTSVLYR
jgi:hypothetical protein